MWRRAFMKSYSPRSWGFPSQCPDADGALDRHSTLDGSVPAVRSIPWANLGEHLLCFPISSKTMEMPLAVVLRPQQLGRTKDTQFVRTKLLDSLVRFNASCNARECSECELSRHGDCNSLATRSASRITRRTFRPKIFPISSSV